MNLEGARKLCAAVIEEAVNDYRMHCRLGHIKDGRRTKKPIAKRMNGVNMKLDSADQVLHFFKAGSLEGWISVGALNIDPDAVRKALGIK